VILPVFQRRCRRTSDISSPSLITITPHQHSSPSLLAITPHQHSSPVFLTSTPHHSIHSCHITIDLTIVPCYIFLVIRGIIIIFPSYLTLSPLLFLPPIPPFSFPVQTRTPQFINPHHHSQHKILPIIPSTISSTSIQSLLLTHNHQPPPSSPPLLSRST
jgi:hypothetical protein